MSEFSEFIKGDLEDHHRAKLRLVDAVPTPFPTWNAMCRDEGGGIGIARGWHVVVAGGTGQGKSLLALNMAAEAIRGGERVTVISLEMSKMQLGTRFLAIFSDKNIRELEQGSEFSESEHTAACLDLTNTYASNGGRLITNREVLADLTEIDYGFGFCVEAGSRYIITDYMQLAWTGNADGIYGQITEVSHTIRGLARKHNVVSIGVSQLNREGAKGPESPVIQQLMGGGPLEQDADQVLLIDHSTYKEDETNPKEATVDLKLGKNRHGSVGSIPCRWDYRSLRIREDDPVTDRERRYG